MAVGIEKRKAERLNRVLEVQYDTDGDNVAITGNISENGLFIRTNKVLSPGSMLHVKLNLPNLKWFALQGKVVRKSQSVPGLVSETSNGLGIQLVDPPQEYKEYIRSLLN